MLVLKFVFACFLLNGSMGMITSPNPSIIIIGSGPSGIAAATKLLKNNFTNLKILEAEDRIGGRINSVKFGDAYVDLGAEFCHGEEDNIVYSMAKDLGILRSSSIKFKFLLSNGDMIQNETGRKIIELAESVEANIEPKDDDCRNVTSVGECLTIKSKKFISNADNPNEKKILARSSDWVKTYLSAMDSSFDVNDLRPISSFKISKGDFNLNWNGLGYKTILEIMMQKYPTAENQLPIDDKIYLQKEVNNIKNWQNKEKVTITTTDDSKYEADHVIFTPSVGVLKANYNTLFNPALPEEKVDAIKNIGFGAILKVIMHFSERWWQNEAFWPVIWTEEDKQNLKEKNMEWLITMSGIMQAENNPNVLIAWYAGSYIPLIETLSDEQILEGQKHLLNTFLAPHFNVTMPNNITRTSWYSNPHFRGTYSYESVKGHSTGGSEFQDKLAKPLLNQHDSPTVLFAGEATHPYHFSTVHGAIESGYREANRLIDFYKNIS